MEFSTEKLIKISQQALTITERLCAGFYSDEVEENDALVNARINQWCQVIAEGNWKQFDKRLVWDGLDLSTIRRALGSVCMRDAQQIPEWAQTLNECLNTADLNTSETVTSGKNRFLNPQKPLPFEQVLLPFIHRAQNKLKIHAGSGYELLSDTAHASLERSLLTWLVYICAPSLELEYSIFYASRQSTLVSLLKEQNYQDFIKNLLEGGLLKFFEEYPVLARLVATMTDLWVDATWELISRLTSDWSKIQRTFQGGTELGKVIAVQTDLSDRHHNGRSTTAVTFTSGLKLIYKPKDLGIEEAYVKLLAWLNQQGISLPFKLFRILNCSTYGWVEFIETLPCQDQAESTRYYQRCGMLLCLAYALDSTDLHYENLIACGEHPVLIDLETLMHPWVREVEDSATTKGVQSSVNFYFTHSVMRTAFLPHWQFGATGQPYDVSGLGGISQQETFFLQKKWPGLSTNTTHMGHQNIKVQAPAITPSLDETKLALENYYQEVVDGFQQMYSFLIEHSQGLLAQNGPLTAFSSKSLRFVFRNTRTYASVLQQTLNPKFLRDGVERSIQLDILSKPILLSDTKPSCWPLLKIEQQVLEQMDIPIFTARSDSDALILPAYQTIDKYFTKPSFNLVLARLNQFDDQDLERQISLIQGSLYSRTTHEVHHLPRFENTKFAFDKTFSLTQKEIVQQSMMVAADIQKRAIHAGDDSFTWIAPQYIHKAKRFQLQPMGYSLFDGRCGVALFLAALENVTGGSGFRDIALKTLQPLCQGLQQPVFAQALKAMGIGGGVGCGSIIYVLIRVSRFLKEPDLLEDAKQVASWITPDLITVNNIDNQFDVIWGAAGGILGLLALHNASADSEVLEKAIVCGNHLLNNRVASDSGYKAWETIGGILPTGLSHGAAGIAYALLRLYQATGETTFLEAAQEAIAYERSVFISEVGNWPDFRESSTKEGTTCMCSWCHGAPGIGLARVAGLDILDTHEIRQDIEAAINTTKQHELSNMDHLCCGNLGRVEFLFTAARKLSQPYLLETAMQQAAHVVARAQSNGGFAYGSVLAYSPGFFQGAAGIGYELLRLVYPDQLPSVLLWE